MSLEPDIVQRIQNDFSPGEATAAIELLRESGRTGRIARCIVAASDGSLDLLREHIILAGKDYRDVIVAGEYDDSMRRVRDLSVSFLIDTPEKFWICEVATILKLRGYQLSSMDSLPATAGPFDYTSDTGEGVATFTGKMGPITIEKKDRKWRLKGDPAELELDGLHNAFEDEKAFRDAVSCYLLAKENPR